MGTTLGSVFLVVLVFGFAVVLPPEFPVSFPVSVVPDPAVSVLSAEGPVSALVEAVDSPVPPDTSELGFGSLPHAAMASMEAAIKSPDRILSNLFRINPFPSLVFGSVCGACQPRTPLLVDGFVVISRSGDG